MTLFLWTIVAILLLDICGKAAILYGRVTERSMGMTAFDLLANVGLLGWALYLIGGVK